MEKQIEHPAKKAEDRWDAMTAGRLIELLSRVPYDYVVTYDTFCASINVGDFAINHTDKEVSING